MAFSVESCKIVENRDPLSPIEITVYLNNLSNDLPKDRYRARALLNLATADGFSFVG